MKWTVTQKRFLFFWGWFFCKKKKKRVTSSVPLATLSRCNLKRNLLQNINTAHSTGTSIHSSKFKVGVNWTCQNHSVWKNPQVSTYRHGQRANSTNDLTCYFSYCWFPKPIRDFIAIVFFGGGVFFFFYTFEKKMPPVDFAIKIKQAYILCKQMQSEGHTCEYLQAWMSMWCEWDVSRWS